MPNRITLSRVRRLAYKPLRVGAASRTRGCPNMRQLPEDRINSVLACGSDAHRFMTEIEVLVTRAQRLISFRPRERKPRKSSARSAEVVTNQLAGNLLHGRNLSCAATV